MKNLMKNPLMLFVVLALGIVAAVSIVKSRTPVEHQDISMQPKPVKVMTVSKVPFRAAAIAYGNVEPAIVLNLKAELNGKVSYLHPDLKQGGSLSAGTVVARIDAEDYEVVLKQTQADLAGNESSLAQLVQEEKNVRKSLELAQKNLAIEEKEFIRFKNTWKKGVLSSSELGAAEQKVIQLRQTVDDLEGQLGTFASRKAVVEAQIARSRQQVKSQQTTLGRTEIVMPFDARIGDVKVEQGEYVSTGTALFEAHDVNSVEVTAQLPVMRMRGLVGAMSSGKMTFDVSKIDSMLQSLGLEARVRLVGGMKDAQWKGRVLRFSEAVDPVRRTLGIVIGVDKPYQQVIPGKKPPLLKGMYVAVDLFAPEKESLLVPRKAVHEGRVYIAGDDDRLEIRSVEIYLEQGDILVIEDGIAEGERVILNDLVPVIPGMPLQPGVATDYVSGFLKKANGESLQ